MASLILISGVVQTRFKEKYDTRWNNKIPNINEFTKRKNTNLTIQTLHSRNVNKTKLSIAIFYLYWFESRETDTEMQL